MDRFGINHGSAVWVAEWEPPLMSTGRLSESVSPGKSMLECADGRIPSWGQKEDANHSGLWLTMALKCGLKLKGGVTEWGTLQEVKISYTCGWGICLRTQMTLVCGLKVWLLWPPATLEAPEICQTVYVFIRCILHYIPERKFCLIAGEVGTWVGQLVFD